MRFFQRELYEVANFTTGRSPNLLSLLRIPYTLIAVTRSASGVT